MKKYTAEITGDYENVKYEIDGWGQTPQDFHKTVITEHIKWPHEEVLNIFNERGNRVFNIKRGFNGS